MVIYFKLLIVEMTCKQTYEQARETNPVRWSGQVRNWDRESEVLLNPAKKDGADVELPAILAA